MKVIEPHNKHVLCVLTTDNNKQTSTGFIYKSNDLPIYRIVSISKDVSIENLHKGDMVVTNSEGTLIELDGTKYYLIKEDNIAGVISYDYA